MTLFGRAEKIITQIILASDSSVEAPGQGSG